jgi:methylenetetrahydrofolate reductase (NADPH)
MMTVEITTKNKITKDIDFDDVFITWLPNQNKEDIIRKVKEVFLLDKTPIPHIPAKKIKSREQAYQISNELSKYCRKVLLIGGSGNTTGVFSTVDQLVQTGAFDNFEIGVGGFPEGNGTLSYNDSMKILNDKAKYASFVVTQWSLNKKSIKRFLDDSPLPVYLGIPNKCSVTKLVKFAKLCGIESSVKGILSNPINMIKFFMGFSPKYILNKYKNHKNLNSFHLYSFGNLNRL